MTPKAGTDPPPGGRPRMTENANPPIDATQQLAQIVDSGNAEHLAAFLHLLAPDIHHQQPG